MIKMGDKQYEWVLLHIRNGEQFAGMVEVPSDLKNDADFYKRCLAADIMQSKIGVDVTPSEKHHGVNNTAERIIELRNPQQIGLAPGDGKMILQIMPMNLGDMVLFIRAGEVLFAQFLDEKSPIVIEVERKKNPSPIVPPLVPGEARTDGGIILPGAGAPARA